MREVLGAVVSEMPGALRGGSAFLPSLFCTLPGLLLDLGLGICLSLSFPLSFFYTLFFLFLIFFLIILISKC